MENIEQELKQIIVERYGSLKKFCDKIEMPWTTLDSILKRGIAKANIANVLKITTELGIDAEGLANQQINNLENKSLNKKGVQIRVLGRVRAGIPIEAIEDVIGYEEITETLAKTGEFFALKIKGDSMESIINDGDIVIVKKEDDAESGSIVIALVNGDDGCCKKLIKNDWGITLQSMNAKYAPMVFTNQEIIDKPVKIIGKVVELRRKF